jgi:bifunctional DNA-binding transcriptional regulator/antitoxin component of YhaV-PrlF toxin-antitoxin module
MNITKLSTKGQIVIPEKLRKDFVVGSSFAVTKLNGLIVLKPIIGFSKQEEKEILELSKAWAEIDSNNARVYSQEEFFEDMKKW